MMKKILITGGCGFIGTSLIFALLQGNEYIHIRVLDNFTTGQPKDLRDICSYSESLAKDISGEKGVFLIKGDIRDLETAILCAKDVDCIVHLAANTGVHPSVLDPLYDMQCNVIGTLNMLEAARRNEVGRFVFASSGAPAGEVTPPIHEELPPHPVSPYGASKLAGEGYCSAYYRTFGVETVCLRFGNVYGPGSGKKSSVVAKFIRRALDGETCHIYGDGGQTRDFIYIDDLIKSMVLAISKAEAAGETFQIASGKERTVMEVTEIIAAELKKNDVEMHFEHEDFRQGDVRRNYSDTSKALKLLGWRAETDVYDGMMKTVSYFLGR